MDIRITGPTMFQVPCISRSIPTGGFDAAGLFDPSASRQSTAVENALLQTECHCNHALVFFLSSSNFCAYSRCVQKVHAAARTL